MRELRRLFLLVLVLTFVGGVGTGAFIGSLSAAPDVPPGPVERRVQDWERVFDLTPSQLRRLREVLARYDKGVREIRDLIGAQQYRQIEELRQKCRAQIREEVLTEPQRIEYDRRGTGG